MEPAYYSHFLHKPIAEVKPYVPTVNQAECKISLQSASTAPPLDARLVDVTRQDKINRAKNCYTLPTFEVVRDYCNPFEPLGKIKLTGLSEEKFITRAALKLASVDAYFNLSQHTNLGYTADTPGDFSFCDLAGGPGSFTQYLLFRRPQAQGYGITLNGETSKNWKKLIRDFAQQGRLRLLDGSNDSGNLFEWSDWFVQQVRLSQPNGVDLVVADGGEDTDKKEEYAIQESINLPLVFVEMLTGLRALTRGGQMVIKIFESNTLPMAELIYIMSLCFKETYCFKPVSSRPANTERYLVFRDRRDDVGSITTVLSGLLGEVIRIFSANNQARSASTTKASAYISRLLAEDLPTSFVTWLQEHNTLSLDLQARALKLIVPLLNTAVTKDGIHPELGTISSRTVLLTRILTSWGLSPQGEQVPKVGVKSDRNQIPLSIREVVKDWSNGKDIRTVEEFRQDHLSQEDRDYSQGMVEILYQYVSGDVSRMEPMVDIGCMDGKVTKQLANRLKTNIIGLELNSVPATPNIPGRFTFMTYDGRVLPFGTNSVGLVIIRHVLHHIEPADRAKLLIEIHRVLKPGGSLFIKEHDCNDEKTIEAVVKIHELYTCAKIGTSYSCLQIMPISGVTMTQELLAANFSIKYHSPHARKAVALKNYYIVATVNKGF